MATKTVCDRCGAEINPISSAVYCTVSKYRHDEHATPTELCCSCGLWLRRYLDGEAMVLRQEGGNGNA